MEPVATNLNEINVRIDNFRQLIYCLNILGRLKANDKLVTPKQVAKPWRLAIQQNTFSLHGLWTRFLRSWNKLKEYEYAREENLDYVKSMAEDLRKDFTFLFQYISKYIVQNNKDAIKHWHSPVMTFDKDDRSGERDPKNEEKDVKSSHWLQMKHMSQLMKKDEQRAYQIHYRLCKCTNCLLSYERMTILRVADLLVQALAAMVNAVGGLDFLRTTYEEDEGIIANIQCIQTELNNMGNQYVNMAITDEDNECMIRFERPFVNKSEEGALP